MCVSRRCLKTRGPLSLSLFSSGESLLHHLQPPSQPLHSYSLPQESPRFLPHSSRRIYGARDSSCCGKHPGEEVQSRWCNHLPILITQYQYAAKVNMSINGPQGRDHKRPAAYEMQIRPFRMLHTPLSCVISAMSAHSNYLGKCTN